MPSGKVQGACGLHIARPQPRPTYHCHPEEPAHRTTLVVTCASCAGLEGCRPGPSPFEAPPAQEAGIAPRVTDIGHSLPWFILYRRAAHMLTRRVAARQSCLINGERGRARLVQMLVRF